jgi:hypothetical protein
LALCEAIVRATPSSAADAAGRASQFDRSAQWARYPLLLGQDVELSAVSAALRVLDQSMPRKDAAVEKAIEEALCELVSASKCDLRCAVAAAAARIPATDIDIDALSVAGECAAAAVLCAGPAAAVDLASNLERRGAKQAALVVAGLARCAAVSLSGKTDRVLQQTTLLELAASGAWDEALAIEFPHLAHSLSDCE